MKIECVRKWVELPFDQNYFISSNGELKRKDGKVLKGYIDRYGYKIYSIKGKSYKAHRLVLMAFIGDGKGLECRHLDNNRLNNNIDNLKWGTRKENERDKYKFNTDNTGSRHGRAKLNEEKVLEIRKLLKKHTRKDIANKFDVSKPLIDKIATREIWRHI